MLHKIAAIVLAFIMLAWVPSTYAWGNDGHYIVGAIADANLSPAVRQSLEFEHYNVAMKSRAAVSVINNGASLAAVASQADVYRGGNAGKWSSPMHFADMPDGATKFVMSPANCPNNKCVVAAIQNYTSTAQRTRPVRWPYAGSGSEPSYISMLTHFVGDVHQPLHVGWAKDLGGNQQKVTFFGKQTNLHSLWDSGFITQSKLNKDQLLNEINQWIRANPNIVAGWKTQRDPVTWADESFQIVRSKAYAFPGGSTNLGQPYYDANWQTVKQRLAAGGIRLAAAINGVYGN